MYVSCEKTAKETCKVNPHLLITGGGWALIEKRTGRHRGSDSSTFWSEVHKHRSLSLRLVHFPCESGSISAQCKRPWNLSVLWSFSKNGSALQAESVLVLQEIDFSHQTTVVLGFDNHPPFFRQTSIKPHLSRWKLVLEHGKGGLNAVFLDVHCHTQYTAPLRMGNNSNRADLVPHSNLFGTTARWTVRQSGSLRMHPAVGDTAFRRLFSASFRG